ncbi:MAG TPA: hypothetical protein VLW84_02350 [Terriglobales bacterium]|nr:hypothetical protein [Terriglobales bacterium]
MRSSLFEPGLVSLTLGKLTHLFTIEALDIVARRLHQLRASNT